LSFLLKISCFYTTQFLVNPCHINTYSYATWLHVPTANTNAFARARWCPKTLARVLACALVANFFARAYSSLIIDTLFILLQFYESSPAVTRLTVYCRAYIRRLFTRRLGENRLVLQSESKPNCSKLMLFWKVDDRTKAMFNHNLFINANNCLWKSHSFKL
jgi:hypothetical protein